MESNKNKNIHDLVYTNKKMLDTLTNPPIISNSSSISNFANWLKQLEDITQTTKFQKNTVR